MTVEEASSRLAIKVPTLRRMIRRGQIPVVRPTAVGSGFKARAVRIRAEDVEALMNPKPWVTTWVAPKTRVDVQAQEQSGA
jgi:excisionase family DNA binding protein